MKIILTFLPLVISTILVAQNNPASKHNDRSGEKTHASAIVKPADKKIHYVDKRTAPAQNNSNTGTGSQSKKKTVVHKSENQEKTVSK